MILQLKTRKKVYPLLLREILEIRISLFGYINNGDGMRVFITGGRSGIGYEVGKFLAERGHLVYLGCRTVSQVFSLREKLKSEKLRMIPIKFDITSSDIFMLKSLKIDALFCHAGVGVSGDITRLDIRSLKDVYEVNVFSNIKMIQLMISVWKKEKKKGKIVVTSSLLELFPLPGFGVYSSSKAALSMFIKCLSKEEKSISFCLVELGAYSTGFNQVMIDNMEKYQKLKKRDCLKISMRRKLFSLLESKNILGCAKKVALEIEKRNPKKILRIPFIQGLFLKVYFLLFG